MQTKYICRVPLVALSLLFAFCYLFWTLDNWSNGFLISNYVPSIFFWVCFLIIFQITGFILQKVSIYDFSVWYLILSYFFMFGLIFNEYMGFQTTLLWSPSRFYNNEELFHSYIFIIWILFCYSVGYLFFYSEGKVHYHSEVQNYQENEEKILYNAGRILTGVGFISRVITDSKTVLTVRVANSYSAYSEAASSGIIDDLGMLMLPGVFSLFYSDKLSRVMKRTIFGVVLFYLILIMILTGSRKIQVFSILSLILVYSQSLEITFSKQRVLAFLIATVFLLNVLVVIRGHRFDLNTIGTYLFDSFSSLDFVKNILGEVFSESGLTSLTVASAITVVPSSIPYEYGMTFLRTIPSIFPIGWLVGDFFDKASATVVINKFLGLPVGSSFVEELFWNFGYYGSVFLSFVLGIISGWRLNFRAFQISKISKVIYFSVISQLLLLVRSSSIDVYRPIMYSLIMIFIFRRLKK